jgi:hypothetical protein
MRIQLDTSSLADYQTFLKIKSLPRYRFIGHVAEFPDEYAGLLGIGVPTGGATDYEPYPGLFDYQAGIAGLAIRKKKFAAFVEPGYGKTFIYSEFIRHALKNLPEEKCALTVAPNMVVDQSIAEYAKFYGSDFPIEKIKAADLTEWILHGTGRCGITNYEALKDETPQGRIGCLLPDESSHMKSAYGKHGQTLIRLGRGLEWKMAGTGTPAPNDRIEFANHAVFLDAFMTANSFLSRFFVNKGQADNRWEIKPHAVEAFYLALSDFSIFMTDPATYGWKDNSGTLPPINVHILDVPLSGEQKSMVMDRTGDMFGLNVGGITSRSTLSQISKGTLNGKKIATNKPEFIRDLVDTWPDKSTLIWCIYNAEQETMEKMFPGAISIDGKTPQAKRPGMIEDFRSGKNKVLISKAEVLGFGMNLQVATKMVFSGLEDSFENYWQCVKRANRVGSTEDLDVYLPVTSAERPMIQTVLDKAERIQEDTETQERIFRKVMHAAI